MLWSAGGSHHPAHSINSLSLQTSHIIHSPKPKVPFGSPHPRPRGLGEFLLPPTNPYPPMSQLNVPPPQPPRRSAPLYKQKSWSPDLYREEAWLKRKAGNKEHRRSKSVTDEDVDELKGCIELGFGFDSPEIDRRLSDTLPALGLYYAVNKHYYHTLSNSNSSTSSSSSSSSSLVSFSSSASEADIPSPLGSPHTIFCPGDDPQTVKTRLRQWAQVVACSVRQSSSS